MVTLFDTNLQDLVFKRLGILIYGTTLDKSLTAMLSRMIYSYHTSVGALDAEGADTAVYER